MYNQKPDPKNLCPDCKGSGQTEDTATEMVIINGNFLTKHLGSGCRKCGGIGVTDGAREQKITNAGIQRMIALLDKANVPLMDRSVHCACCDRFLDGNQGPCPLQTCVFKNAGTRPAG